MIFPSLRRRVNTDSVENFENQNELMSTQRPRSSRLFRILGAHHRRKQQDPEKAPSSFFPNNANAISSIAGPRASVTQYQGDQSREKVTSHPSMFPAHHAISSVAGPRRTSITATETTLRSPQTISESVSGIMGGDTANRVEASTSNIGVSVNTTTLANRDSISSYLTAASENPRDPFDLISAYKDERQLKQIKKTARKSNVGGRVAKYHKKQNEVR